MTTTLDKGSDQKMRRQKGDDASSLSQQVYGTSCVVTAVLSFSLANLLVKAHVVPLPVLLQIRFTTCWAMAAACLLHYREPLSLAWFGPRELRGWLVLKAVLSFAFLLFWWKGIQAAPLGDCTALIHCSPVLTAPLAALLLGESLPRFFPAQMLLIVVGVVLVAKPNSLHQLLGDRHPDPAYVSSPGHDYTFVLLALLSGSMLPLVTRKCRVGSWIEVEHVSSILAALVFNPAVILMSAQQEDGLLSTLGRVSRVEFAGLVLAGALSFAGHALETFGYQLAEPGKASIFRVLEVPFAFVLQWFCAFAPVTRTELAGTAVIVLASVLGAWGQNFMARGQADETTPLCKSAVKL